MADIFISYASEDRERVIPIVKALEEQGWSTWWDSTSIPVGKTWRQFIQEGLEAARCVLVIWSKTSVDSEWVLEEADFGKKRKLLVPAMIDDLSPPLGFGQMQAAILINWTGNTNNPEFKRLLHAIEEIIGPPKPAIAPVAPKDDHIRRHVFIAYVRENQKEVDRLYEELEKHGVEVWLDRNKITPGIFWEDAIRKAIQDGAFFIACFSKEYKEKTHTHMNEELNLAIEVLRKRPLKQTWFIPVVLSGYVPDWEIFPGKTLQSIQWVPLYEDWDAGIQKILSVIKPVPPEIQNLIYALRSDDIDVRLSATFALEKINTPEAQKALEEYNKHKSK